jgi:hypothetical protein
MATIQPGLFGYDPTELQQAEQRRWAAMYGQAGSPYEKMGMALGQIGGSAIKGLFGIEDPAITANKEATSLAGQYDLNTAAGLKEYTTALQQRAQETGNPSLAAIVPRAAAEYQKAALAEATIEQKTREKQVNIGEKVNQQLFAKFQQDAIKMGAKPDQVDAVAAQLYDRYETEKKVRVAGAAVPPSGQVPLGTIDTAMGIVDKYTGAPKKRLEQISVLGQVGEAVKTNPTLLPQFKRDAVKFAGDNQVGQKEVKDILGSAGFAGDTIDGVNAFLTGGPTNAKIDDVLKGFKVLEKAYAEQYNTGRKKAETVLTEGKINEQTRNSVLPPAYNTKPRVTAPAVGTIKNGYQFLGGDPANQSSWKAVK